MFLSEARGLTPINFWDHGYAGNTDDGTRDMAALFGKKVFDNPKPVQLMTRILEHATASDSLVLDFFAGSGTMAEAVLRLNSEAGGSRQFIQVQLPEETPPDSTARLEGYERISDITRERIAMAIQATVDNCGLRSLRLANSGFRAPSEGHDDLFDLSESTLDPAHPDLDSIAAEALLKEGVMLGAPWERAKAGGKSDGQSRRRRRRVEPQYHRPSRR